MTDKVVFYLFRAFQSIVFGLIAYFLLDNIGVSMSTSIVLSVLLVLSTFIVGYAMYSRK